MHTPGPWLLEHDNAFGHDSWTVCAEQSDDVVCTIDFYDSNGNFLSGGDVAKCNAALVAAAPDLLEALQWFIQPDHPIGSHAELVRKFEAKAKEAIAKAVGNQAGCPA